MRNKNFFMLPNRIFSLGLKPKEFAVYAIGYAYKVDGVIYPVCAYFPMEDFDEADEKIKYLISGGKK